MPERDKDSPNRIIEWIFCDTKIPSSSHFSFFHLQYIGDYFAVIVLFVVGACIENLAQTHDRFTPPSDPSLSYPLENDIIPLSALYILSFGIPVLMFLCFQLVYRSLHDFHHATLGVILTLGLVYFLSDVIKVTAGRQRPDYFAMIAAGMTTDAKQSFVSGHSSFSFAAFTFLSFYICGKLHIYSNGNGTSSIKLIPCILPLVLSSSIAITRTIDYHHNYSDILAGAVLGVGIAFPIYFCFYPSLFDPKCHVPKMIKRKVEVVNNNDTDL